MKLNPIIKKGANFLIANRAEVLAGMSLLGLAGTVVLSGKSALAIDGIMRNAEESGKSIKDKDILMDVARAAMPAAACAIFTGGCIVGSSAIAHRQYGALMAAYMMGKDKLELTEKTVKEAFGEDGLKKVQSDIAQQRVLQAPVTSSSGMVLDTGYGNTLVYDPMTSRYFKSSAEAIRRAQNDLNEQIIGDWSATLNEFYRYLGLQDCKLGDDLGWNTDNILRITFDSALTSSGEPVLVMNYEVYPEYRLL